MELTGAKYAVFISPNSFNLLKKKREVAIAALLSTLFIGTLSLLVPANAQQAIQANISSSWIVDEDLPADFHTIQEAIDAASSGDTVFVRTGTYRENITINKPLCLMGEDSNRTIIASQTNGKIVTVTASNVTIGDFTVEGTESAQPLPFNTGIYFTSSATYCNVSHNVLKGNGYGIVLAGHNHRVDQNYVADNGICGIYLNGSSNNAITRNNVTGGKVGIFLSWPSNRNVLRDNNMTENQLNFHVTSYDFQGFINDVDTSNTVDGKPIYYWMSKINQTVPKDAGTVILVNCAYIRVQDLELAKTGQGVLLAYSNMSVIQRNRIMNCDNAVRIQFSSNNTVRENEIYGDTSGVALVNASSNVICNNTIMTSLNNGIFVFLSSGNAFYHNNLTNRIQVYIDSLALWNNIWDNGYPAGGNYWSNYNGTDENHDGIGDTPFVIDANNRDRYPLMSSWNGTLGNVSGNNKSSTVGPSENLTEAQNSTKAAENATADNATPDVIDENKSKTDEQTPQGEIKGSSPATPAVELTSESTPSLLTALVVTLVLVAPMTLTIYCAKMLRAKGFNRSHGSGS